MLCCLCCASSRTVARFRSKGITSNFCMIGMQFGDDLLSPFLGGQLTSSLANSNQYGRSIPIDISGE